MCTRAYDHNFAHICDSIKCSEIKSIKGQDVLPFLLDKHPDDVQNGVSNLKVNYINKFVW